MTSSHTINHLSPYAFSHSKSILALTSAVPERGGNHICLLLRSHTQNQSLRSQMQCLREAGITHVLNAAGTQIPCYFPQVRSLTCFMFPCSDLTCFSFPCKCVCMIEFCICPPLSACVWISSAPLAPSCSSVLPLTMAKQAGPKVKPLETHPFFSSIYTTRRCTWLIHHRKTFCSTSRKRRNLFGMPFRLVVILRFFLLHLLTFANNAIQFNAIQCKPCFI